MAAPVDARGFRTFLTDPNAGPATQARYVSTTERVSRRHGGKRRNLLRWATTLLEGVFNDDLELVDDALAMPLATRDAVVTAGRYGAPLSFGGEAVVSHERVKAQQRVLLEGARDMADKVGRFYSDNEWQNIDSHLERVGAYATGATFDRVELGDTALHIAVRHGSFAAARRLLDRDYDPLVTNFKGESFAKLLDDQFQAATADETLKRHQPHQSKKQTKENQRIKRNAIHSIATVARQKLDDVETTVLEPLAYKQWRSTIEGRALTRNELATLALRDSLRADRQILQAIIDRTPPVARPAPSSLTVRALFRHRETALLTIGDQCYGTTSLAHDDDDDQRSLSSVSSSFFDDVDLEQWLADLDRAALLVQAAWRSYSVRTTLVNAVRAASAIHLQARVRGFLTAQR